MTEQVHQSSIVPRCRAAVLEAVLCKGTGTFDDVRTL